MNYKIKVLGLSILTAIALNGCFAEDETKTTEYSEVDGSYLCKNENKKTTFDLTIKGNSFDMVEKDKSYINLLNKKIDQAKAMYVAFGVPKSKIEKIKVKVSTNVEKIDERNHTLNIIETSNFDGKKLLDENKSKTIKTFTLSKNDNQSFELIKKWNKDKATCKKN